MPYAEILIDHAYSRKQARFTYKIPDELNLHRGDGVEVPFQKGTSAGLVLEVHNTKPSFPVKDIIKRLEPSPFLEQWQLKLAEWISEYYFCSIYDSIRLFLPKNIFRKPKKERATKNTKIVQKMTGQHALTEKQVHIVKEILERAPKKVLIQGVTGSGKTEIYQELIKNCIQKGAQALFLVPEISLTPQFLRRLSGIFPEMAVVHSQVSEGEKARIWKGVREGSIPLVLGSRSALFSPFKQLGLIVIDEEHEWSYKQDQSPRYHTREVAFKIQELIGTQIVLGSATPSIESRTLADKGEITLFKLEERIQNTPLPEVKIVDMRDELRKGNYSVFSDELEQKIRSTLEGHEQVILFLNRRGSASSTLCRECGKMATCSHCELPFTYHARNFGLPILICHHCGRTAPLAKECSRCGSTRIKQLGTGTEKVEMELQKRFPFARIARADKDTMNRKKSFHELHEKLMDDQIDILIGTQMIGKGWDLPKVTLVGVLLADLGMSIPDFRTEERLFQLLTQVAGRAGRREKQGRVLIQSYNPELELFHSIKEHNYDRFYEQEIESRKNAALPPFSKLVKIMILRSTEKEAKEEAKALVDRLVDKNHQVFCAPAFLPRVKGKHQWNLLIQGPHPREQVQKIDDLNGLRIDVDPLVSI